MLVLGRASQIQWPPPVAAYVFQESSDHFLHLAPDPTDPG